MRSHTVGAKERGDILGELLSYSVQTTPWRQAPEVSESTAGRRCAVRSRERPSSARAALGGQPPAAAAPPRPYSAAASKPASPSVAPLATSQGAVAKVVDGFPMQLRYRRAPVQSATALVNMEPMEFEDGTKEVRLKPAFRIGAVASQGYAPEMLRAALDFNGRHQTFTVRASSLLTRVAPKSGALNESRRAACAYDDALIAVSRNRLVIQQKKQQKLQVHKAKHVKVRRRKVRMWDWPGKIWEPRRRGNTKYFYETDQSHKRMLDLDWKHVLEPRLQSLITRATSTLRGPSELDSLYAILEKHHDLLLTAFDYYCIVSDAGLGSDKELLNLHGNALSSNCWNVFCAECKLVTEQCSASMMGSIWVASNSDMAALAGTESQKLQSMAGYNHAKFMNRHEFFEGIIRVAIEEHSEGIKAGDLTSADAASQIFRTVAENLPLEAKHNSNELCAEALESASAECPLHSLWCYLLTMQALRVTAVVAAAPSTFMLSQPT